MMAWGEAVPSTPIELVSRLTEQAVTPGTLPTAFSTRALQAAQLIPVMLYCSIVSSRRAAAYFISRWITRTSSSTVSYLPASRSSTTQVRMCWASNSLEKLSRALLTADA